MSIHKQQIWRAARYLVIAFALGGWFTGTALAQTALGTRSSKTGSSKSQESDPPAAASAELSSPDGQQAMPTGMQIGNYNVQGSLNMGWRYSNITGSQANYDTFVNLQQGPRLLDFSINAYSLNHKGQYFDNMSLTGFGFGGDPVDVVRLNMTKNKWYDFDATYRRYKYFWNYNLLANPLNPSNSVPAVPVVNSPHLMDLSHRMTDLQLKLLPQSAVHFRLGYTHSLEKGPSYTSDGAAAGILPIEETSATTLLLQNFKTSEDNYDVGVDFAFLPRTTISYDEFVQHYKEDTFGTDANLNYQVLVAGSSPATFVPVDLGLTFYPGTPCATPVTDPNTTPPTANPGVCNGDVLATHGVRPRATIPTERFGFQTTYFRDLNMTGAISYSSGSQTIDNPLNYNEWIGLNTRTHALGTNDTATTKAKRIIVNGNWDAVYDVTSKFRVMDSFAYNVYRIPGVFNFNVLNYFAPAGTSATLAEGAAVAQNPGQYLQNLQNNCPPDCPEHPAGAGPDLATGYSNTYLAQELRVNTFMLAYDFNRHVGAHIGYRYTKRKIHDAYQQFYTAEIFYPGGAGAARGDCSSGCNPGPVAGSLEFTGLDTAESDLTHNLAADINGNSALFGLWVRPASNFRTSFDMELFSADQSFTRITPRQLRHYQIHSTYTPVRWVDITGALDIVDSSDNVIEVQNKNHDRSYGLTTTFMPDNRFSFDLSYNYNDVYTQAFDCFTASGNYSGLPTGFVPTVFDQANNTTLTVPTCPLVDPDGNASPVSIGAISAYQSRTNFGSADMMFKPVKQVTFTLGYAGSFVRGTPTWLSVDGVTTNFTHGLTPWGPLRFNYQLPYLTMNLNLYKGFSYVASWNYYAYNSRGNNNPTVTIGNAAVQLAPLGTQDFNGNNMTMSARYNF